MDTGKIGGNKYVDYTFKDFKKDRGLSDAGVLKELDKYGYNIQDFVPVAPVTKRADTFREKIQKAGLNYFPLPVQLGGSQFNEQEYDPTRGVMVGKNRPTGPMGGLASYIDGLTYGLTDLDQLGGGLLGSTKSLRGFGGTPTDYELPADLKETLALQEKAKKEKESTNPVDNLDEIVKAELKYKKGADTQSRKGRVLDSALEFLNYSLTSPKIINDLKDVSTFKQQQLLDAEAIKQGLPNAQQARMLAASTGFANEAQAVAAQQDAATRFAGLGMQRPFGQPSFKVS